MSERKDSDFLTDILAAAERIQTYPTDFDYQTALKTISGEAVDD